MGDEDRGPAGHEAAATGDDNLALQVLADADVDLDALRATTTRFIQADAA